MNVAVHADFERRQDDALDAAGLIRLAVLAVGGQGGGVLTNWILSLAEQNGYFVQTTSVPGVAQRTGATIYYIEMLPGSDRQPVLALMPTPGDVDIVVASELMEAGRAVTRGFVTPDRTRLITSTHRMHAVSEKIVPGDGIVNPQPVLDGLEKTARSVIAFDLAAVAERHKAHISASLFGALAGSRLLPFERDAFEATIRSSKRGVEASLAAFHEAFELARGTRREAAPASVPDVPQTRPAAARPKVLAARWQALVADVETLPKPVRDMALAGLQKAVDYQDADYGKLYLETLRRVVKEDTAHGGEARNFDFSRMLAKHLANAMCYDDVIRVADLKTRRQRYERIDDEYGGSDGSVFTVTEYMHPRAEEFASVLPAGLGRRLKDSPLGLRIVGRIFSRGRRVRTDRLSGFLILFFVAGLRRFRRRLLRHHTEEAHWRDWLDRATVQLPRNYDLAVELLRVRRLIKGYGDTHARGHGKYDKVIAGIALVEGRDDAAEWARRLIDAGLQDAQGKTLEGALETVRSFVD
ncbi:MAG: indolepyruvate oxidoreductase subunit beta family protein [Pseudomonadota bacterium]